MKRTLLLCISFAAFPSAMMSVQAELPPLIPRNVLFGNPDKASPRISPDGKRLAYLAPHEGVLNVWVRTLGARDDRVVTADRQQGIRSLFWAPSSQQLLYVQDKGGDQNWHLYSVELTTGKVRDLTPYEGVTVRVVAMQPTVGEHTNEILVALNKRTRELHDVYRLDLDSAVLTLELENKDGFIEWTADHTLRVRAAGKLTPDGGFELMFREKPDSTWQTLITWGPEDVLSSGTISFTPDGTGLHIVSSQGTNTGELREFDLLTGKEKTLASDRQADVANFFIHPVKHTIQAVSFNKERIHWKVLDESIKKDFAVIKRIRRGDFHIVDRDAADRTWLIAFDTDDGPVSYYTYDRESRKASFLFTNRAALEGVRLAKMVPIGFRARDGLPIHGYLPTPHGIAARNLPTVLLVHRSPWGRNTWGYSGVVQWLANRGYAVLQINFRGAAGYGKHFINAANRELGGKVQDDLIDGVKWAIGKRIADPERIAIFGTSLGGYLTLNGLATAPDLFCCGVDICGPSNLATFLSRLPPHMKPIEPLIFDRIGHPVDDAELLRSWSPLYKVEQITKPLLIAQGANDAVVNRSESLKIVEALKKAGKTVEYVEYSDEGHEFARPENRLDFYARAEKFLAKYLGGRYEE